ncbi:hypothetical protein Z042_12465 [Chania multitudinisentens RB-25]|uniref:Peptidase C39-like domain-containing protein n=1 Tax=Chania multitudinisentens RB-25 TaxID=1441930 RepID=W0LK19_9GAMM|nr:tetratricopeptide repeat protein [Chania multitudinisentens]AHG22774.1 hypothetical protein Z042_12465 [Chania multitudinisentens RB-25]
MTAPSGSLVIQKLNQLCDNGYHIAAWEQGIAAFGPLGNWPGAEGQELACQIASHFGLRRIYQVLVRRGYQRYPNHHALIVRYGQLMLARRGALYTFEWINTLVPPPEAETESLIAWLLFQSNIYAYVRDFTQAQQYADSASRLCPNHPAVLHHCSTLAQMQDHYEEALRIAESSFVQYPDSYLCHQQLTHILTLCGQEKRALASLQQFIAKTQNVQMMCELIILQLELKQYPQAIESLNQLAQCLPPELTKLDPSALPAWISAMRCDLSCIIGDLPMAQEQGKMAANHLVAYRDISARLLQAESFQPQKLLDVAFIRQHHKTCVPATLTVIAHYWGEPADHLSIADEICYDGTSHYSERKWAENQGWIAHEFTIDWNSACLLIDKEIPFTLTTTETTSAHLQTVIGYSPLRKTLICRDPYRRLQVEFEAEDLFYSEAPYGIRGMVLVPASQKARLAGLNLPDKALWDGLHEVNSALDIHDRPRALRACLALRETAPDHLLALQAERTIASYDSNPSVTLKIEEKILERYPNDTRRQLSKASLFEELKTKREYQQWVEEINRRNPDNPYIQLNLAAQLQKHHASYAESEHILRRVMRQSDTQESTVWTQFANLRWKQQQRSEALQYYRHASTLQYTNESAAERYFQALHCLKQTDAGLNYLQQRHYQLGQYSSLPTITLCEQYEKLGRMDEALPLLTEATERHSSDSRLLLFTANMWSRAGEQAKAEALLEKSRPLCNRSQWLQTREAVLLRSGGDNQTALALLQEASELEPFNSNLHNKIARKLDILHGRETTLAWLKTTAARFPHHKQLNSLYAFWLKKNPDERLEAALRHLLDIDPDYQWAIRELAYCLSAGKRFEEAQEVVLRAVQLAPNEPETVIAQGFLAAQRGNKADKRHFYRQALCLDIDQDFPAYQLMHDCHSLDDRIEEVTFFCQQLQVQNSHGDALLTLQDIGQHSLSPNALLDQLELFHQQYMNLWQSRVAVARQLIRMQRFEEAVTLLEAVISDFPLLSEIPYELAQIFFSEQRYDECLRSLKQVLRLDPWSEQAVQLAVRVYINQDNGLEAAYELLEQSLNLTPESSDLMTLKGIVLWRQDKPQAAIQALTQAIWQDTDSDWAWNTLHQYTRYLNDENCLYQLSQEIAQQRPNDVAAHLALAQYTPLQEEKERALQTVLTLSPRHIAGHEAYLNLLFEQWRYDEMSRHFSPELWGERPPLRIEIFRARQLYMLGQHQLAIEKAQALLAEDPERYTLWQTLADWLEKNEDWAAFLTAAENMVRLQPESAVALGGYLAAAYHHLGKLEEAKHYYRQALQYEPEYAYALTQLFDLLLQAEEIDEAKALWALQQQRVHLVIGCGLKLAEKTKDEALQQSLLIERITHKKIDDQRWRESNWIIEELALEEPLIQHITDSLSADRPINTPALLYWLRKNSQDDGLDLNLARQQLELGVAAVPNHNELNAWLIYLLWQQNESEAALVRLEQQLTQNADDNWCWARLKEYGEKNQQPLRAHQLAQRLVTLHPKNEHAWLALITLSSDEQREDIYTRFVQLFPRHVHGHERYLELLLEMERFDEMLPYLAETYWGGYVPAVIQVLTAKRLVALEQRREAINMLESTVQTIPDDSALWYALADLYRHDEIKNAEGYLYASQQLTRLRPDDYVSLGYVAHAHILKQDKNAAIPYLEKAIALSPSYSFATNNLFDIQFENDDFSAAKQTLDVITKYVSDGDSGLRTLKLGLKIHDDLMLHAGIHLFIADFEMSNNENNWQTVLTLLTAVEKLHLLDEGIENILLECQEAAWIAMDWWLQRHKLSEMQKPIIDAVMQKCSGNKAILAREILSSIGNWSDKQQVPYLLSFIQRYGHILRADPIAHAKVSYALNCHELTQETIDWMHDWQREDIRPWCLSNLLTSLLCERKNKDLILRVAKLAHQLQPDEAENAIWHCAALIHQGAAPAQIASLLDEVAFDSLTRTFWQGVYYIAQGYIALLRDNDWTAAASHLGNAVQYHIYKDKGFCHLLKTLKWRLFRVKGFKAMRLLSATQSAYAGFKAFANEDYDRVTERLEPLAHFLSARPIIYLIDIYNSQQQYEKMMFWLKLGAENHIPGTYYNLALAYYDGRGTPRNLRQALRYFHLSVKNDNDNDARYMLARMYQTGEGYGFNPYEAARQFHAAAELGHTHSAFAYAVVLYNGEDIEQNNQQAVYWFKRAADDGHMEAKNWFAYCLYQGLGIEQDQQAAVQLCLPLAEQGQMKAQYILGEAYESGSSGLPEDRLLSLKWYMEAAKQGDSEAQRKVGDLFCFNGSELAINPDYNAALEWYNKAAEQENIVAIHHLGWMHEKGLGVEADLEQAAHYYLKSAEKGFFQSCFNLALLFARQDQFTQAEYWLEKAAQAGNDEQKLVVAMEYYASDNGIPVNEELALHWFNVSAKMNNRNAQQGLAAIYGQVALDAYFSLDEGESLSTDAQYASNEACYWGVMALEDNPDYIPLLSMIGLIHYFNENIEGHHEKAINYLQRVIELEKTDDDRRHSACYYLSNIYETVTSSHYDLQQSYFYLNLAAQEGNANAQYMIAQLYLNPAFELHSSETAWLWLHESLYGAHDHLSEINIEEKDVVDQQMAEIYRQLTGREQQAVQEMKTDWLGFSRSQETAFDS